MADDMDRYEWTGRSERWAAVSDARRTGLSITRATLARHLSPEEGWFPEGLGEVALEILRLAARERERQRLDAELVDHLGLDAEVIERERLGTGPLILGAVGKLVDRVAELEGGEHIWREERAVMVRNMERLAARERQLLALTGKQHEMLRNELLPSLIENHERYHRTGYCYGDSHAELTGRVNKLEDFLASPDAQKAVGELEELRTQRDELRQALDFSKTQVRDLALCRERALADNEALRAEVLDLQCREASVSSAVNALVCEFLPGRIASLRQDVTAPPPVALDVILFELQATLRARVSTWRAEIEWWEEEAKALRARVQELEGILADQGRCMFIHGNEPNHDEQAVRAMRGHARREARLSRLDSLLASEEAPAEFVTAAFQGPAIAQNAWRWFREQLAAPPDPERSGREGDSQPLPIPNGSRDIQSLVIEDIQRRREVGIRRYGTPLQAHNGRNALRDLYEELLDGAMYARQRLEEESAAPPAEPKGERGSIPGMEISGALDRRGHEAGDPIKPIWKKRTEVEPQEAERGAIGPIIAYGLEEEMDEADRRTREDQR